MRVQPNAAGRQFITSDTIRTFSRTCLLHLVLTSTAQSNSSKQPTNRAKLNRYILTADSDTKTA